MKSLIPVLVLCALFVAGHRPAHAISRAEDAVRDLRQFFPAPSRFPPNNALRPVLRGQSERERTILPFGRQDEGPPEDQRIEPAPAGLFPWAVAIVNDRKSAQESFVCAGVLIAPGWVLTAAHCGFSWVQRWPVDARPYVLADTLKLAEPGPTYPATQVIQHPDYDPHTLRNDIALIKIDTQGKPFGPPIQLEGPPITGQVGEIAYVVGWGITNATLLERRKVEVLQIVQMVVRGDLCFSSNNFPTLRNANVFCASSLLRYHDTCYRFGGGPIILRDAKGVRYLAGLVAWPAVCPPRIDKLNVYLDVQPYVPWIKSVIKVNGGPPS
jgi:secreted trypsin-like serine protease